MPEDSHPHFSNNEEKLIYFTLPMALNYQRDSYKLWESAKKTFEDKDTGAVFALKEMTEEDLRRKLLTHKLALQPNKHIDTWKRLTHTFQELGGINPELLQLLEHIVLTHLSLPEWGSPRLPLIPEVLILHHADDLDAKLEMYLRCLTRDQSPGPFR